MTENTNNTKPSFTDMAAAIAKHNTRIAYLSGNTPTLAEFKEKANLSRDQLKQDLEALGLNVDCLDWRFVEND